MFFAAPRSLNACFVLVAVNISAPKWKKWAQS
jgi:hypothetical protein